jgi:hypothetical protein
MAIEERFTELPTVSSSTMSDIICAVQGYVSPSNLGLSTQQSLQSVYNLFQASVVLTNSGNPNGVVAGNVYQLCWDSLEDILWVCTTSGTVTTAVWQQCISQQSSWVGVQSTPVNLLVNRNYVTDNGATLVTFTLPPVAEFGATIEISGKSSGGWLLAQNAGQSINFGNISTTVGVGGSLASSNQYDFVKVVCVVANTTWNVIGSMGMITIV